MTMAKDGSYNSARDVQANLVPLDRNQITKDYGKVTQQDHNSQTSDLTRQGDRRDLDARRADRKQTHTDHTAGTSAEATEATPGIQQRNETRTAGQSTGDSSPGGGDHPDSAPGKTPRTETRAGYVFPREGPPDQPRLAPGSEEAGGELAGGWVETIPTASHPDSQHPPDAVIATGLEGPLLVATAFYVAVKDRVSGSVARVLNKDKSGEAGHDSR
jgi:hypothetical protein